MENIIEVHDLTKKFGNFVAVDSISFDVKKGEIFGFLGPNGAGKSTTIRILTTLLNPTSGQAQVAGHDVVKKPDLVREHIGLVAEKIILYNHLTADENFMFFGQLHNLSPAVIRERADKWLKRLHMEGWRGSQVGTYSTGMKQRINIVRALLTEPEVLFLDEPTLGLDPQTTRLIRDFIRELNDKGTNVVLTTHDMYEAEILTDHVAIIDRGKIAALNTKDNLKKRVKDVSEPTLEDVFLEVTGREIRDIATGRVQSSRGHFGPKSTPRAR